MQSSQSIFPPKREEIERFETIRQAALKLNINYRALLKAVQTGAVPSYKLGRTRILVKIEEITACMAQSRDGGNHA